ncbi:MAG TPA: ribose-5-phosphate isomerase RpiA [Polyangiaceae bacterium]|jgi:ribose 5-phosphate isomerase A
MADATEMKRIAARAAIEELPEAGIVGLGSGSTSRLFVEELAPHVAKGRKLVGVPTSESTRALAASLGIPLLGDEGPWAIDVNVDGADEVSEALDLVKGGGAAHAREKIVNYAAKKNVVIVDESKLSKRLGEKWPVPVEVLVFAHGATRAHLEKHGEPVLRVKGGAPVKTDAGNLIYDLRTGPIADPGALDRALRGIPGVVETGLFVGRADVVVVAGDTGVKRLRR